MMITRYTIKLTITNVQNTVYGFKLQLISLENTIVTAVYEQYLFILYI